MVTLILLQVSWDNYLLFLMLMQEMGMSNEIFANGGLTEVMQQLQLKMG
jgi:hypothetical protein